MRLHGVIGLKNRIGVIANPSAGKDIRRLASGGGLFDFQQKVETARRILVGAYAVGVKEAVLMPDELGISSEAASQAPRGLSTVFLDMKVTATGLDSTRAAEMMNRETGCIVTIGGDGTNRMVAKGCAETPLLPVSTGTNNMFSYAIDGTVAGLVAGSLVTGRLRLDKVLSQSKKLAIRTSRGQEDIALIDVSTTTKMFTGAKALVDSSSIQEAVLTRSNALSVGVSALCSQIKTVGPEDPSGLHVKLGKNGKKVLAALTPGRVEAINVESCEPIGAGKEIDLSPIDGTVALDGEREFMVDAQTQIKVTLNRGGPRIVNLESLRHDLTPWFRN